MHISLKVPNKIKKAIQALAHNDYHAYKLNLDAFMSNKKETNKAKFMLHTLIYIGLYCKDAKYAALLKSYPAMSDYFETASYQIKPSIYTSLPSRKPKAQAISQLNQDYSLLSGAQIKSLKTFFPSTTINEFVSSSVQHFLAGQLLQQNTQTSETIQKAIKYTQTYFDSKAEEHSRFKRLVGHDSKAKMLCDILFMYVPHNKETYHKASRSGIEENDFIEIFEQLNLTSKFLVAHFNEYVSKLTHSKALFDMYLNHIQFDDLLLKGEFSLGYGADYEHFIEYCLNKNWKIEKFFNPEKEIEMISFPSYLSEDLKLLFSTHKDKQMLQNTLEQLSLNSLSDKAQLSKKVSKI